MTTPEHMSHKTFKKLNELGYEILSHLHYYPDLSPIDYHFFKYLNNFLWEDVFKDQASIQSTFFEFVNSRTSEYDLVQINKLVFLVGKNACRPMGLNFD